MKEERKKLFSSDDFDKILSIGDELVFDKPELTNLRIDLTWTATRPNVHEKFKGKDLDICAFLLGKDGMIHEREDLVYFGSRLRWKTIKDFNDPEFNPLDGAISKWEDASKDFKNPNKWMEATLPLSNDCGVIGSWDDMAEDDPTALEVECGETMHVLLNEINTKGHLSIVFAAVVAKDRILAGETFADAHDPVVTIYNAEDEEIVAEYKLASAFPGKDAVCFGKMEFNEDTFLWNFVPMDDSYNGGLQYLAREIYN